MMCTDADGDIRLFTPQYTQLFPVKKIDTVSTIGAGDNFNAGIIYGLMKENVCADSLANVQPEQWNRIISHGQNFAAEVCQSLSNSISKDYANNYGKQQ